MANGGRRRRRIARANETADRIAINLEAWVRHRMGSTVEELDVARKAYNRKRREIRLIVTVTQLDGSCEELTGREIRERAEAARDVVTPENSSGGK